MAEKDPLILLTFRKRATLLERAARGDASEGNGYAEGNPRWTTATTARKRYVVPRSHRARAEDKTATAIVGRGNAYAVITLHVKESHRGNWAQARAVYGDTGDMKTIACADSEALICAGGYGDCAGGRDSTASVGRSVNGKSESGAGEQERGYGGYCETKCFIHTVVNYLVINLS